MWVIVHSHMLLVKTIHVHISISNDINDIDLTWLLLMYTHILVFMCVYMCVGIVVCKL